MPDVPLSPDELEELSPVEAVEAKGSPSQFGAMMAVAGRTMLLVAALVVLSFFLARNGILEWDLVPWSLLPWTPVH